MEEMQADQLLYLLGEILTEFRRMAAAAEAQVEETKAMRARVERLRRDAE